MNPLRVGISTSVLEPVRNGGHLDGIGVYTAALRHNLAQVGVAVRGYSFPIFANRARMFEGDALPRSFPMQMLVASFGVPAPVGERIDVFHCTDYKAVRMPCPVVTTLHDAIPLKHPEWTGGRFRALKSLILRRSASYADHVIALSYAAIPDLVEYFGVNERRISVVPCGVDAGWFHSPSHADVEKELSLRGLRRGYFLYVGTLQPRKNVVGILNAYEALPEAIRRERQLVIVGRAGWHCEEEVSRLNAARDAGDGIVWLDGVRGAASLRRIYAGAGVFVFPSLYEGYGIPVLEAFASGLPVVTSNISSLPEVAGEAALKVDPKDPAAIADAMQRFAESETLCTDFVELGRNRAKALSWENTARMTAEVYRRVAS
ncbi:glycosyltransferase family 4 protein [Cupriavidus oxalaticus]|uniref:Glycosyltransferase family 1 protein n=1 Tax=Cupriavidus oxalaticus TaxID=96344 RepID=A0A4P7LDH9_9BURK|nr:glycosyltransferase family 1 protein [Cupriavidus oxalaticus]QBY54020.1 glycosyltransferase family 1 protein [Cupriavidus oxalaticus]